MKKILSLFITACLLITVFSGCGKKADTDTLSSAVSSGNVEKSEKAKPLIWEISNKNGKKMYLMGTIHAGDERSKKVIESADKYLSSCDALAVEFDVESYKKDSSAMTKDLEQFILIDGTTIKDHMPSDLYKAAVEYLNENSVYYSMLDCYNTAFWDNLIESAAVESSDLSTVYAIDSLLIKSAYKKDIPVLDIESANEQYKMLNRISADYHLYNIDEIIKAKTSYGTDLNVLYKNYIAGDVDTVQTLLFSESILATKEEKDMIQSAKRLMIDERNNKMTDAAVSYINSGDTVFFAVGTAHLLGDNGIIAQLNNKGYTAKRVKQ